MSNEELLNRVHTFLSNLCRDGKCGEYCSACLDASDLADDVWNVLHSNEGTAAPTNGLTFGQAIDDCCYRGAKIQRVNWNGEGQFVRFEEVLASEDGKLHTEPQGAPGMVASGCFVFHFVNRKTGETGIQVGWLASQADMQANDWRIVE